MEEAHSVPQGSSYLNNGLLGYILYYIVYDMWLVTYYLGTGALGAMTFLALYSRAFEMKANL